MDREAKPLTLSDLDMSTRGAAHRRYRQPSARLAGTGGGLIASSAAMDDCLRRATSLAKSRRYADALEILDEMLRVDSGSAIAWSNRCHVLARLGRFEEALAAGDRALGAAPDLAEAWFARAHVLSQSGRHDVAFAAYDRAFAINPDLEYLAGYRLLSKLQLCDWNHLQADVERLLDAVRAGKAASVPFVMIAAADAAADQLQCARRYIQDRPAFAPIWRGEIHEHERIRVAYLSSDFHASAMACLLTGLFERHDRSRFEVTGISFGPDRPSPTRERLRGAFERFIDVRDKSDQEIARIVHGLEIDIAVDLNGFTRNNRLDVFAQRPAPIQVNYVGYPGTMAADYIDYIIADSTIIPEDQCGLYGERVIWLPTTYLAYDDHTQIAARTASRREVGLPDDAFVFCCFNNSYKIRPEIFDIWMRLLKSVDESVLWLLDANPTACNNLRHEAEKRGVRSHRLVFAPRTSLPDHLARHRLADLFLDTLPCNAHTTASDALWAGLPVLTCLGETFAGRVAASLLRAIELEELVARSLEHYEALALRFARDGSFRSAVTRKLARNRVAAALFDTERRTREIEKAYTLMWDRFRASPKARAAAGTSRPLCID